MSTRMVLRLTLAILVLVSLAIAAVSWVYTNILYRVAFSTARSQPARDIEVIASTTESVTLRAERPRTRHYLAREGLWGIEWDGGSARIAAIEATDGETVTRALAPGSAVPAPGTLVSLSNFCFVGDPQTALGIPFDEITFESELGPMPAWHVPGDPRNDTWVIAVHGKGSSRHEALRILPTLQAAGYPVLVPAYRNDPGVPPCPGGRYAYGLTEWRDIDAAIEWALAHSARRIVLFGFSMGGAIVGSVLRNSGHTSQIEAVILDSPMLSFSTTVDGGAKARGFPTGLLAPGRRLATIRFGFDWQEMEFGDDVLAAGIPVLLFHGSDDELVPVTTSRDLAADAGETVRYVEVAGAQHVRAWNVEPDRYESAVLDFLGNVTGWTSAVEPAGGSTSGCDDLFR